MFQQFICILDGIFFHPQKFYFTGDYIHFSVSICLFLWEHLVLYSYVFVATLIPGSLVPSVSDLLPRCVESMIPVLLYFKSTSV
jgi:hypothetical protein